MWVKLMHCLTEFAETERLTNSTLFQWIYHYHFARGIQEDQKPFSDSGATEFPHFLGF